MVKTRAEAVQYVKDAGGLKLVVFGADGHEVAAMFVQGSVRLRRGGIHFPCGRGGRPHGWGTIRG